MEASTTSRLTRIVYFLVRRVEVKIAILFLMLFSICFFFYLPLSKFYSHDAVPDYIALDEVKQREFGTFTVKVTTGMYIRNFPVFDMFKNAFTMDCIVWFEFNSDEISLDTVGQFSFEAGKIVQKSSPDIKINGNRTFVRYDIRAELKSNLVYKNFPLEDHKLGIVLINNFTTPSEMYFVLTNSSFQISPNIFVSSWLVKDLNTDTGYANPKLDASDPNKQTSYPLAVFTVNFQKSGIRKILIIFIPIFFAMLLSFFSLIMNLTQVFGRSSTAASAVSAILGYRFVIEQMMPDVGYFTTTDWLYLLLLGTTFAVFCFQLIFARIISLHARTEKSYEEKGDIPEELNLFKFEVINTLFFVFLAVSVTLITGFILIP